MPRLPRSLLVTIAREAGRRLGRRETAPIPSTWHATPLSDIAAGRPRRMINATGVLLHTNLGRAPLHPRLQPRRHGWPPATATSSSTSQPAAVAAATPTSVSCCDRVTGAEAGLVVNNNAAALLLSLAALAARAGDRESAAS